jgi:hypothetical protein
MYWKRKLIFFGKSAYQSEFWETGTYIKINKNTQKIYKKVIFCSGKNVFDWKNKSERRVDLMTYFGSAN